MAPFTQHRGIAAALMRSNIDTDTIIPSTEMKTVSKIGLADGLFANLRYLDASARVADPDFVLNHPNQLGTSVLLCGSNFGCGSSREHAVWALKEYGIRVVIAPSFGAIFAGNCVRNGILPMVLSEHHIDSIARAIQEDPQARQLVIDLEAMTLVSSDGERHVFSIQPGHREMLLSGLDPIAMALTMDAQITAFQNADREVRPWIYL